MSRVMLLHGLASSFERNWRDPGWVDVLAEAGHDVVPFTLPGHGPGPHPADPEAYTDVASEVLRAAAPVEPVDAVGFSAGAEALLLAAVERPVAFHRLALLGIGSAVLDGGGQAGAEALALSLTGPADPTDTQGRLFRRMASVAGNALPPVVAYLRRPRRPLTADELARIRCPVLVVLGEDDPAAPADRLVDALPDARLVTLRRADHFATATDPRAMDAVLRFLTD